MTSRTMAPKPVSRFARTEQPINWVRAFVSGAAAATVMMSFIDIFYMMGLTPFSFEAYLGVLIRGAQSYGPRNWVVGLLANWVVGGIFAWLYAYGFEYKLKRSGAGVGVRLGAIHAVIAAVAIFPFFNALHEEMKTGLYPRFGILGSSLNIGTPFLIFLAHLLYGATVGLFYGPVRRDRVRMREFEPGETGMPGDPDVITPAEDPEDRLVV